MRKWLAPNVPVSLVLLPSSISTFLKGSTTNSVIQQVTEALRTFAVTLFANLRTIDKLGRYGGEEFLLILPDTAKDHAVRTLDRLRSIVSEVDWAAISGSMNLTMSAGICSVRQEDSADG